MSERPRYKSPLPRFPPQPRYATPHKLGGGRRLSAAASSPRTPAAEARDAERIGMRFFGEVMRRRMRAALRTLHDHGRRAATRSELRRDERLWSALHAKRRRAMAMALAWWSRATLCADGDRRGRAAAAAAAWRARLVSGACASSSTSGPTGGAAAGRSAAGSRRPRRRRCRQPRMCCERRLEGGARFDSASTPLNCKMWGRQAGTGHGRVVRQPAIYDTVPGI